MLSFVSNQFFGFVLNLVTVMCFAGLHEVARELESPFQNVPNDVPLNNFQGQFNEGLMTMFYGFHPDSFWQVVVNQANTVMVDCTSLAAVYVDNDKIPEIPWPQEETVEATLVAPDGAKRQ